MLPPQDDRQSPPAGALLGPAEGGTEATCYGVPPPAEPTATNDKATVPPPADGSVTRYDGQTADPGLTYNAVPPPPDDSSATRYSGDLSDPPITGSTPSASRTESPSGRRLSRWFGGYELLEKVGHGGMGVVYKARQTALDRLVALKMIRSGELACDADIRYFRAEANEVARLDHPNIVPVYEVGEWQGHHFFSMKLIEGGSLDRQLERFRNDPRAAARLVATVARAVHHAHQRQLLHRDLKPGNILLDADGQPHVADFGLAKRMGNEGEASQSVGVGTPEYMAPEQARGERLTTAADVYALGGILYALLSGRPPFRGPTHWETIQQLLSQPPAAPSTHAPGCSHDLETVCLKCLEKEPARRYGSAEALAEELERWLAGEPVRARPIGRMRRAWRWCRRSPALAGALAALAVTILGGLVGLTALYVDAVQQQRTAEQRRMEARAVNSFYEHYILTAARPKGFEGGAGRDVTLKEVLDRAAPKIDEAFAGRPRLEAQVRDTLGMTYWYQGQYDAAEPHLEKAYALRLQVLGPDDPDTLTSLNNLARLRWRQGRLAEAADKCRQALEGRRRRLGPDNEDTLWSQIYLGIFLLELGQLDEAADQLNQAVASCRAAPKLGPDHHHTLWGQGYLAWTRERQGKLVEAEALFRQTLESETRALGPEDTTTLLTQCNLARVLGERGDPAAAEPLLRANLEAQRRVLGPEYPRALFSQDCLAAVLADLGKLAEAEQLCRQSLAVRQRVFTALHPDTLATEENLARVLGYERKFAEAEKLFHHVLDGDRQALGPDHPQLAAALADYGSLLIDDGRPAEAEPLLRQALAICQAKLAAGGWQVASSRSALGACLTRQGKFAEAEPLLRDACDTQAQAGDAPAKATVTSFDRVIELYERWGKTGQAEAWRQKRAAFADRVRPTVTASAPASSGG